METAIRHKLFDIELAPPETSWQKIAAELDDSAIGQKFPLTLYEYAVNPGPGNWDRIAASLNRSLPLENISGKLFSAEAMPPAGAWNRIAAAINKEEERPVRKLQPFLRYAVAAAVLGLIAFGSAQFFRSGKPGKQTAGQGKILPVTPVEPVNPETTLLSKETAPVEITPDPDEARNDAALEASKKTYASLEVSKKKRQTVASGFHFSGFSSADITEPGSKSIHNGINDLADRYILLLTPDGHFIRVSKKLGDLVCCVSGEDQDKDCKDQVEKWRKQLACSSAAHPGNFIDILSLVSSLQED